MAEHVCVKLSSIFFSFCDQVDSSTLGILDMHGNYYWPNSRNLCECLQGNVKCREISLTYSLRTSCPLLIYVEYKSLFRHHDGAEEA